MISSISAGVRGIIVAVILAALVFVSWKIYNAGYKTGKAEVQQAWDAEKIRLTNEYADAQTRAREKERALQARVDNIRKERAREIADITRRHDVIVAGLRDRAAERAATPSGVPESTSAGVGCTGAGLARPDAEFLAGYAADAARLQSAFSACQTAYDSARRKVAAPQ